jgi:hypothetical protein
MPVHRQVHAGVRILMDDGEIELCVTQTNPPCVPTVPAAQAV